MDSGRKRMGNVMLILAGFGLGHISTGVWSCLGTELQGIDNIGLGVVELLLAACVLVWCEIERSE